MSGWTRYHVFPYLGLVLFLCGGLPSREGSLFVLDRSGPLSRRQARAFAGLVGLLLLAQLPTSYLGHMRQDPDPAPQQACLRRIEEIDARCRAERIDGRAAAAALDPLVVPYSFCETDPPRINGWELLRGSPVPVPRTPDEIKRLLDGP
jgi:hypothetical protein